MPTCCERASMVSWVRTLPRGGSPAVDEPGVVGGACHSYEFRNRVGRVAAGDRRYLFQHGEMALVLLALLRGQEMHGYDLLAELERLLPGYRASPGSVYPALAGLVEEGLLEAVTDDRHARRKSFRITATGRKALQQRAGLLAALEVRTGAR